MNIFYLHPEPKICAEMHCDKHVVKMIIEYAQLMSTAHRVLDGEEYYGLTKNGRKIKRWKLNNPAFEEGLMKASHVNHPSNIWVRSSNNNYTWLYSMWKELLKEYTHRYGKHHACEKYDEYIKYPPLNIPVGYKTQPTQAMPDDVKVKGDSLTAYRDYYIKYKVDFAKWTNRQMPEWWVNYAT